MEMKIGKVMSATEVAEVLYRQILDGISNGRTAECETLLLRLGSDYENLDSLLLLFDTLIKKLDAAEHAGWLACVIYAEGVAFRLAERFKEALDRFELVVAQYQGQSDTVLQRAVARAMYARVEALQRLGDESAKNGAIEKLLSCFSNSSDPIIQNEAIRPLICNSEGQIIINAPAGHALSDPFFLIENEVPKFTGHGRIIDAGLNKSVRKLMQKRVNNKMRADAQLRAEEARTVHNEAMKVFERHRQTREPFALFLRSFDVELHRASISGPDRFREVRLESLSTGIEGELTRQLEGRLPLIGVSNPYAIYTRYRQGKMCPKIEVLHETWRAIVLELIKRACFTVFQITDLSVGVSFEIEALYLSCCQDTTVLVKTGYDEWRRKLAEKLAGAPVKRAPLSMPGVNHVESFPYQIDEPDFIRDGVSVPVFAKLLARAAFVQSLAPDDRRDPGRLEDLYLAHLRSQAEHSSDRARMYERALAYREAGSTIIAHGPPKAALRSYLAALALLRGLCEAEPRNVRWIEDLSTLHEHVGDLLRSEYHPNEAGVHYAAAIDASRCLAALDKQSSGLQVELVCLGRIGDLMIEAGNLEGAVQSWQSARTLAQALATEQQQDSRWQHYLSGANNRLGDLEVSQRRPENAIGCYRVSQNILERLTAADSANLGWQQDLAFTHKKLGLCFSETNRFAEATSAFEKSRDLFSFISSSTTPKLWEAELHSLNRKILETKSLMMGQTG
jgi:tetratricopeptide (TPR) repeat protein